MNKKMDEKISKIENLKEKLLNVRGTATEVYSRIVGYFRPISNWNAGKTEEFSRRKEYKL